MKIIGENDLHLKSQEFADQFKDSNVNLLLLAEVQEGTGLSLIKIGKDKNKSSFIMREMVSRAMSLKIINDDFGKDGILKKLMDSVLNCDCPNCSPKENKEDES